MVVMVWGAGWCSGVDCGGHCCVVVLGVVVLVVVFVVVWVVMALVMWIMVAMVPVIMRTILFVAAVVGGFGGGCGAVGSDDCNGVVGEGYGGVVDHDWWCG